MTLLIKTPHQWDLTQDRVLEEGEMQRIGPTLGRIVTHSFETHPMRNPTNAELKRRVDLATRIYFELRRDLKWTPLRAISHVRAALKAKLDETTFKPRDRAMYARDPILFPGAAPMTATIDG